MRTETRVLPAFIRNPFSSRTLSLARRNYTPFSLNIEAVQILLFDQPLNIRLKISR